MNNDYYVYGHIRVDKMELFYIGLGRRERNRSNKSRNAHWKNIFNLNKGDLRLIIFYKNLSFQDACEKEIELIKHWGRADLGEGPLVNLTDGGEGTPGIIVTKEKAARCGVGISKALKEKYSKEPHHSKGTKYCQYRLDKHKAAMNAGNFVRTMDYSVITGLNAKQSKGIVYQYSKLTGELLNTFESTGLAEKATGIHSGRITQVILGKRNSSKGFVFKRSS